MDSPASRVALAHELLTTRSQSPPQVGTWPASALAFSRLPLIAPLEMIHSPTLNLHAQADEAKPVPRRSCLPAITPQLQRSYQCIHHAFVVHALHHPRLDAIIDVDGRDVLRSTANAFGAAGRSVAS